MMIWWTSRSNHVKCLRAALTRVISWTVIVNRHVELPYAAEMFRKNTHAKISVSYYLTWPRRRSRHVKSPCAATDKCDKRSGAATDRGYISCQGRRRHVELPYVVKVFRNNRFSCIGKRYSWMISYFTSRNCCDKRVKCPSATTDRGNISCHLRSSEASFAA